MLCGKSKDEIKRLCSLCFKNGNSFQKKVAETVAHKQNYACTRKQDTILCAGASYKGGSYVSHWQTSYNDYDLDSY